MSGQNKIEELNWDSNFFGFKVGRIYINPNDSDLLLQLYETIKKSGFILVYVIVSEWEPGTHNQLVEIGAKLADSKYTYFKNVSETELQIQSDYKILEYQDKFLSDELLDLAYQSGIYSRYYTDPRFDAGQFKKLYNEWLQKSLNGTLADKVWVALDGNTCVGFVTLKKDIKNKCGQIGLIAVSEKYRGKKIGQALMAKTEGWYIKNKLLLAKVVTQGDNISACRFYEASGYKVKNIEHYYHLWV